MDLNTIFFLGTERTAVNSLVPFRSVPQGRKYPVIMASDFLNCFYDVHGINSINSSILNHNSSQQHGKQKAPEYEQ